MDQMDQKQVTKITKGKNGSKIGNKKLQKVKMGKNKVQKIKKGQNG